MDGTISEELCASKSGIIVHVQYLDDEDDWITVHEYTELRIQFGIQISMQLSLLL